uniref:PDEase domain-containing protein n=1 Tax=Gongylonema pulchrum TaxID=637853 RepID=A0A183D9E3_9BILA
LEKQMGNRPLEMMDRDRACVPKLQLEFMDTIALPVFEYLSQLLPESKSTYESMLFNRKCWQALGEILAEEDFPTLGLDYLRDSALEEQIGGCAQKRFN